MFNPMTCGGFDKSFMGGCSMAWVGFAILVFAGLIARRQLAEELGLDFNVIGAFIGSLVTYLVVISIFGSWQWSLGAGAIGLFIGGFGIGFFTGGSDGGFGEGFEDD